MKGIVTETLTADYLIVGSGIAGLTSSLLLGETGRVLLLTKGRLGEGNSYLAQGGIAVPLSADDAPRLHVADTLRTGQGLCERLSVEKVIARAQGAIRWLQEIGVPFDTDPQGNLVLGKEGAHSRRRIVHAGGDATGRIVVQQFVRCIRGKETICVRENAYVAKLLVENGECRGAVFLERTGRPVVVRARAVILATGGLGQIYKYSTNAPGSVGDGYALAYEAGAVLRDMEFVQFHPTALLADSSPLPLVSEAVRGEGAVLEDEDGRRFLFDYDPRGELASRDVVARAIFQETRAGRSVYLNACSLKGFASRFPTIHAFCRQRGLDPERHRIPVVPAAHYAMGGILTNERGETTIPGLFAVGEVASCGLHGANRLASNSLLETVVMAMCAAEAAREAVTTVGGSTPELPACAGLTGSAGSGASSIRPALLAHVQDLMWTHVGIIRHASGLKAAREWLEHRLQHDDTLSVAERHLLLTALLVTRGALWRRESRGAHFRADYPQPSPAFAKHSLQGGNDEPITRKPVITSSVDGRYRDARFDDGADH
ncbi:L-aspartate oxidase [Bacillaceae bacterium]